MGLADSGLRVGYCALRPPWFAVDCRETISRADATVVGFMRVTMQGPIHGRAKKPVGDRLAASLAALSYGKPGPVTGPTIAGCKKSGNKITVSFNESLLAGGKMIVQPYYKGGVGSSKMHVLVNSSLFCFQVSHRIHAWIVGGNDLSCCS
jgi:hypothetical protein